MQTQLVGDWRPAAFFHDRYKISSTTWWRINKGSAFPAPIRLGRNVRWSVAECDAFILASRRR